MIVVLKNYITSYNNIENQRQISNVEEVLNPHIVPAGTPLIVPPWVQQQYLQQIAINQAILGNNTLLDFLIHNYSVAAPSSTDEDEDTYYVPLLRSSYLDDDDDDYSEDDYSFSVTEYFDVTNVSLEKESNLNEPVFRTIERADTQRNLVQIPESAIRTEPISTEATIQQEFIEEPVLEQDTPSEEPQTPSIKETPHLEEETSQKELDLEQDTPPEETQTPSIKETPHLEEETSPEELSEESEELQTSDTQTKSFTKKTKREKSYESRGCSNASKEEKTTEAVASCTECHSNRENITKGLKNVVNTVVEYKGNKDDGGGFTAVLKNFCRTCKPVDIKNFMKYVTVQSRKSNIPPEIFFSLVMQESTGKCTASNESSWEHSIGLMQMNKKNSTCLKECNSSYTPPNASDEEMREACLGKKHRRICKNYFINEKTEKRTNDCSDCQEGQSSRNPNACLNNPYCGFEEALHLMKRKWKTGNGTTRKPTELNWLNMSTNQRNRWRNAIISYNRADHMLAAENEMEQSREYAINDWEKKRVYFIKRNWLNKNEADKQNIIHNIAYMERVTGREIPCGGENSIILEWLEFIENNPSPDCSQF